MGEELQAVEGYKRWRVTSGGGLQEVEGYKWWRVTSGGGLQAEFQASMSEYRSYNITQYHTCPA